MRASLPSRPLPIVAAVNETYCLKCSHILGERPGGLNTAMVDVGDAFFSPSLDGRDAPRRMVIFLDRSELGDDLKVRFMTYRTLATVRVVRGL